MHLGALTQLDTQAARSALTDSEDTLQFADLCLPTEADRRMWAALADR